MRSEEAMMQYLDNHRTDCHGAISSNSCRRGAGASSINIPILRMNRSSEEAAIEDLSTKIRNYNEAGPFLTHLPEFIAGTKGAVAQYQKKLPEFGLLLKPVLVGGAVDKTG